MGKGQAGYRARAENRSSDNRQPRSRRKQVQDRAGHGSSQSGNQSARIAFSHAHGRFFSLDREVEWEKKRNELTRTISIH